MKRVLAALGASLLMLAGCRSTPVHPQQIADQPPGPLPAYEDVATNYNVRVQPLDRLWTRTVVRLWYRDEEGAEQNEQVEGNCQYERPTRTLLTFDKVGETYAMLGSNDTSYWWIELGKAKRAYTGELAKATPEAVASAGIRIHPLDVIDLLGITMLPKSGEVGWRRGKLIVTVPARFGSQRLTLDPQTYRPERIEMLAKDGRVAASSELSKFEVVAIKAGAPGAARPWIATNVRISADEGHTRVWMELSGQIIDPAKPRAIAFDLPKLLEVKNVKDVISLDQPRPATER